jgi:dihydrofolate reductase
MSKVVLRFGMSLDGFVAGPDIGVEYPMGRGGEELHDWMFKDHPDKAIDDAIVKEAFDTAGATVVGKRTFDLGVPHWGDTPYPAPSFVVTHEKRDSQPMKSASFTFVNDGIESAVRQAKAAAGDRDVVVMGADIARQVIAAGLADELALSIAPKLLGSGARLFPDGSPHELTRTRVVQSSMATHIWFTVSRGSRDQQ